MHIDQLSLQYFLAFIWPHISQHFFESDLGSFSKRLDVLESKDPYYVVPKILKRKNNKVSASRDVY